MTKRVIIESPFQDKLSNQDYARKCMADSLSRGEAPYASHLLYPQCLSDADAEQRQQGMSAGWVWMEVADLVAVYTDKGITPGMRAGISHATQHAIEVEYRQLDLHGDFSEVGEKVNGR